MNSLQHRLLLVLFLFVGTNVSAQQIFTLSGRVVDSVGVPQKAATVFISGTTRITLSDDKGEFKFDGMPAGTFQLSVNMLGFEPYARNVVIQNGPVDVKVALKVKSISLREVVIGPDHRQEYMNLFKTAFLGVTDNGKQCVLLNPDAINFSFKKKTGILTADADDFLLLENKNLGYKIKYLLKDFSFDTNVGIALYDGETNFEELPGTAKQKKTWAKNRLDTYDGSMMQFLRAVHRDNTGEQGYVTHNLLGIVRPTNYDSKGKYQISGDEVNFDTVATKLDGALIAMKFKFLYINYNGKNNKKPVATNAPPKLIVPEKHGSVINLIAPQAIIDSRGSCSDYRTFYLQGFMAEKRVGDQLPFEYQPPAKR